jgi:xanthine dioxygenase
MQRPFLTPENIVFSPYEEGDLAIWLNRSCRHTAMEYPKSYGPRIMHQ